MLAPSQKIAKDLSWDCAKPFAAQDNAPGLDGPQRAAVVGVDGGGAGSGAAARELDGVGDAVGEGGEALGADGLVAQEAADRHSGAVVDSPVLPQLVEPCDALRAELGHQLGEHSVGEDPVDRDVARGVADEPLDAPHKC